jgi:hypothetical protein
VLAKNDALTEYVATVQPTGAAVWTPAPVMAAAGAGAPPPAAASGDRMALGPAGAGG